MAKISTADPIAEVISEEALIKKDIMSKDILKEIKKGGYIYICSIQAKSKAIHRVNSILAEGHQIRGIKRYGQSGYWHFFVKCQEEKKERKKLILKILEIDKNPDKN